MKTEIEDINRRAKREILNLISDKYKEQETEIMQNFNMGLFTFQEKTRQLCVLNSQVIDQFKRYDIEEDKTYL